jgi:hypothetical protein
MTRLTQIHVFTNGTRTVTRIPVGLGLLSLSTLYCTAVMCYTWRHHSSILNLVIDDQAHNITITLGNCRNQLAYGLTLDFADAILLAACHRIFLDSAHD